MNAIEVRSVVLIEDTEAVRKSLARLLRTQHELVVEYCCPQEFLDSGDLGTIGCLIVDFRLPWMDGRQLLRTLAEQGIRIPTILVSGLCDEPIMETLAEFDHVSFLPKPLRVAELFAAVEDCLDRSSV